MRKLFTGICVLAVGLATCTSAFADYSDSSSDSGVLDDLNPFSSTIMVGVDETITDVEITVNMNHDWLGDISATLTNGDATINLMIEDGGAPANLGVDDGAGGLNSAAYTFSDAGLQTILEAVDDGLGNNDEVPEGTYRAEGTFSVFADASTAGNWTLSIIDNAQDGAGGIDGWSISFTSNAVPEPGSATLLGLFALGLVTRRRR